MNSCSRLLYPHHPRANSCSSSALIKTFSLSFHNFLFKTTENSRENWNWLASTIMHRARTWVDSLVVTRWKFSGIQELFCGDIYVWWSLELWEFVGGERVEVEFFELFEFLVTKLHRKAFSNPHKNSRRGNIWAQLKKSEVKNSHQWGGKFLLVFALRMIYRMEFFMLSKSVIKLICHFLFPFFSGGVVGVRKASGKKRFTQIHQLDESLGVTSSLILRHSLSET